MRKHKFAGNMQPMKDKIYSILNKTIKLDSHDLYVTNGHTTTFTKSGRYLNTLPEFFELTDFVLLSSKEWFDNVRIVMCWANVYPTGSFIRKHNHVTFDKMLSAVLYLQGDGTLHFDRKTEYIEEGNIILFPGHLKHWSEPNEKEQDRIIVGYDLYHGNMTEQEFKQAMLEHERFVPTVDYT